MFDAATAQLLRSAPDVPGLDSQDIPALLTTHYANLVSARLRGAVDDSGNLDELWSPDRIADTYELIASLLTDGVLRKAAAFVAGTAQQIVARRQSARAGGDSLPAIINRERVDPTIAAAVLFLAAEQYADANEAASLIDPRRPGQLYEAAILAEHVADLARGQLVRILERAGRWRRPTRRDLDDRALAALLQTLIAGVEMLAAHFLGVAVPKPIAGRFDGARAAFMRVLELSAAVDSEYAADLGGNILNTYPGPHHLAALLLAAHDGIVDAALITLPPPDGADTEFWERWVRDRAARFPFVWPNHREAIAKGFYQTANLP